MASNRFACCAIRETKPVRSKSRWRVRECRSAIKSGVNADALGALSIFWITADELIECKLRGTSAALGEATGQLKRYSRSFPGSSLTIAVLDIEPEARWLAEILRREGIDIIEVGE